MCTDAFVGTLCAYAALQRGCMNGFTPDPSSPAFAIANLHPGAMVFPRNGVVTNSTLIDWAEVYANFCPDSCNLSDHDRTSLANVTGGASMENVTTCNFLASNGYCFDGTGADITSFYQAYLAAWLKDQADTRGAHRAPRTRRARGRVGAAAASTIVLDRLQAQLRALLALAVYMCIVSLPLSP